MTEETPPEVRLHEIAEIVIREKPDDAGEDAQRKSAVSTIFSETTNYVDFTG
jgi:hypothetical protein